MIIKALCRRYKRWNPVHPTLGAFWGMGIGVGCGVGWGPGFGPDVIGYVGAGCGVGFNVGITFAGVGLGLPANFLIQAPYNAFAATSGSILEFARSNVLFTVRSAAGECWNHSARNISCLRKEASTKLSSFNINLPLNWNLDMNEIKRSISHHAQSALRHSEVLRARHLPPCKGTKD